ncbi:hypothetical protein KP509_19G021600 [Ceratopteris richardii]|uniref:RRM domain-containing protein n=1 Tax=Ceratopteris richardii TaxID=49495 RepID=A0A8T2SIE7_CERRI|nr:hypothetical protein KP509_19G021600 [Ceratopteris richardii]
MQSQQQLQLQQQQQQLLKQQQAILQQAMLQQQAAFGQREDTTGHFNIFVGDLAVDVTDATLFTFFSIYPSCSDAVGFGFVSFRNKQDAEKAIVEMNGKWIGSRVIRCNWATNSGTFSQGDEFSAATAAGNASITGSSGGLTSTNEAAEADAASKETTESGAQYTTVYVGNLAHEVTLADLHTHFLVVGAGIIEDVRIQRDKGFGFVRYRTHDKAALF